MENDARAHPRYEVDAAVEVEPAASGAAPPAPEATQVPRVHNLSLGGICLQTSRLTDIGVEVEVVLRLGHGADEVLALPGQVVWVNREPPEDVGIRWLELAPAARESLLRYLARFTAPTTAP